MSTPARRLATWEDVASLPEGDRTEVLAGELYAGPSPLPRHGRVQGTLSHQVGGPFDFGRDGPGGWWIIVEVDAELTRHDVLRPDLSGWRRQRLPLFPDERPIRVVPDWVCEVTSPSSVRADKVVKPRIYLAAGVPFLWTVDPEERLLEAFESRDGAWLRLGVWGDGDVARIAPFDAVEIDVGLLFPPTA